MKSPAISAKTCSMALLVFSIVVLNIGIMRGESSLERYLELRKSRNILDEAVNNLDKDTSDLKQEIQKLRNSPTYAKKVLRDKYHVTEENEDIIFFAE